MKASRWFILLIITLFINRIQAQIVNKGLISVKSGATLYAQGDIYNFAGGSINNAGTVCTDGSINNAASAVLMGSGNYKIKKNWYNVGVFTANSSKVYFLGSTNSYVSSGGKDFFSIYLNKTSGADLLLASDVKAKNIYLQANASNILLGNFNLSVLSGGIISGATSSRYIVSNGTGGLTFEQVGSTAKIFPLGSSQTTYNPLTVAQLGTVDNIWVRCLEEMNANGGTGTALTNTVKTSWQVLETVAGGSNLSLTAQWAATDQAATFNRQSCAVASYNAALNKWELSTAMLGAAQGTNPYTRARTGVTALGYFGVSSTVSLNPPIGSDLRSSPPDSIGQQKINDLSIYPNPAVSYIEIRHNLPDLGQMLVLDSQGRLMAELNGNKELERMDIERWPIGLYFVYAKGAQGAHWSKAFLKIEN